MNNIKFGPAGNSESFEKSGYKSTLFAPEYVAAMGLNAYEYQCGHGVRVNAEAAQKFKENADAFGVTVSLHAPYFISLCSLDEVKRDNSVGYILDSARAVLALGGTRLVIHPGGLSGQARTDALSMTIDTLLRAHRALCEEGLERAVICPETMGKTNQLGDIHEVAAMCRAEESFVPCIDFGHLNARTSGGIKTQRDYEDIFDILENAIGKERTREFHSHFSKIEYTQIGGEKRHLTFADKLFGPDYEPFLETVYKRGYTPTVICESAGTQAEDALTMKEYFKNIR